MLRVVKERAKKHRITLFVTSHSCINFVVISQNYKYKKSFHLRRTVLAESTPRSLVAVQLKLALAVCTFEIFKYSLSKGTFSGSQLLHEMEGFGFPSTRQISDAVFPRSTKNFSASVTLGETVRN